ncbi:hypothetical protein [Asanoa siamensis]|uniref:ATP/GTP-binding protein n=1 Tax=Asanoa siamensis TaxID=926357 RepID=A0ABQ4CU24_9ACTN|nr:hypothetical protein [Asanoa siamensis]GIF74772.1 hypothetical protein Asi02nite_42900 [Asanoa siamensis]
MLTRHKATRLAVFAAGLILTLAAANAVTALAADGGAECPPNQTTCEGWGEEGGGTGNGGGGGNGNGNGSGGGGGGPCVRDGEEVPCQDPLLGWFNSSDGCYYRVAEPQPAGVPEGMTSYIRSCGAGGLAGGEPVVLADPPPGFAAPDPAELANRALASLDLLPPELGIAPEPGKAGLVGLPVWLWVPADTDPGDDESSWGPLTASESEGGVTVNLVAVVERIVWDMGDGNTVTCTNPGTPYVRQGGRSPTCGYDGYRVASKRSAAGKAVPFEVSATTTWSVTWGVGDDQGNTIGGVFRESDVAEILIDELQVVTK